MTLEEQVKMLKAALEKTLPWVTHGNCGCAPCRATSPGWAVKEQARAALAATAEPAKDVADLVRRNATSAFTGKPIRSEAELHAAVETVQRLKTAEPATPTYSAPQGEHEGCYSADDLRKVAEAVRGACRAHCAEQANAYSPGVVADSYRLSARDIGLFDLDTIIAKAVGRETTPTGRVKTACPHDSDECHRIYIRERALTHALAGVSDPAALLAVFDEMRAALEFLDRHDGFTDLLARAAAVRGGR